MAPIFTGSKLGFGISPMLAAAAAGDVDPDAASLYFAYSYDNTNQVNDVQNIIRSAAGVSNGTLKNLTRGSAAAISATQKKFYTRSLYTGNDFANGNTYASHSTMGIDFYRMKIPFTVQFWVYYNSGPKNNFPSDYAGDMGAIYEPGSGRSGWKLSVFQNNIGMYGYYSGDSTRGFTSTATTTSGQWYHFAAAVSGGGTATRVYRNGVLLTNTQDTITDNSVGSYGATANNSGIIYISGRGTDYTYDSRQDFSDAYYQDVKWYSTARSGTNIINEYNAGRPIIAA